MTLQKLCALLILLSLAGCGDKTEKHRTARDFPQTVNTVPEFSSFQESSDIDQMKAKLAANPNDFNTLSALGDLYFESSRYLEAIQTFDQAIMVNPTCADCFNDKGLALFYTQETTAALASFDKAIALDPAYIYAWLSKGFVLVSTGRYQEAVEPLNKVKELDTTGGLAAEADKFLALIAQRSTQ